MKFEVDLAKGSTLTVDTPDGPVTIEVERSSFYCVRFRIDADRSIRVVREEIAGMAPPALTQREYPR